MIRIKKLALSAILALFIFGGVATTQSNTIANAKRIHAVKHHKKVKKHKKSAWKKGVPSELRGYYNSKVIDGNFIHALDMYKKTFVSFDSGMPVDYAYNVRYKKVGHNEYTFLYNVHKMPGSIQLGAKNIKITIIKIDNKHIKYKGHHYVFFKVKKDKILNGSTYSKWYK